MKKNKSQNGFLASSWQLWDFLREEAGLDIDKYDKDIAEKLCFNLHLSVNPRDLRKNLKENCIATEHFLGAFLKTVQPYAHMMSQLYKFFYDHGMKKTNQEMKILFDFSKGPEDLNFDLQHFKETIEKFKKVYGYLTTYGWHQNDLWSLVNCFDRQYRSNYQPKNINAQQWLLNYSATKEFSLEFPVLPSTEIDEIDESLHRVWLVWISILQQCRTYSRTLEGLKSMFSQPPQNSPTRETAQESEEELSFQGWDARTLYYINTDHWLEHLLRGLFGFVESLLDIPPSDRLIKARPVIQNLQQLFSGLPYSIGNKQALMSEFLELLNLPFWQRRHELYQTWVLAQVDLALQDYQRTIYHSNGSLILKFSGTQIGSIDTEKGKVHIWSELKSPLSKPVGKGRKRNIQPDYSLTTDPITNPDQTLVAIECKQYFKANLRNFRNAIIDYARGRPNAQIVLLNYGKISMDILNSIDDLLRPRCHVIGNFAPGCVNEFEQFKQILIGSIPPLLAQKPSAETDHYEGDVDLIAVDISGSMANVLEDRKTTIIFKWLIVTNPRAKLIAIDSQVRGSWDNLQTGLPKLLSLSRSGSTNVSQALQNCDLQKSAVMTDPDGWNQLNASRNIPYLTLEIDKQEIRLHFRQ